jgi:large subunit ribosomal protein L25
VKVNTLRVESRQGSGKSLARKLRASGKLPGVAYGEKNDPMSLSVAAYDFYQLISKASSQNILVDLDFDNGEEVKKALVREVQVDPVTNDVLNVDFLLISLDRPLNMQVSINLVGVPDGVKNQGGILQPIRREIEISVLPNKVPDKIDLDVTDMQIGDTLHVGDLETREFDLITDPELSICTVVAPTVVKEKTEEEGEEGEEGLEGVEGEEEEQKEPEVIGEKKDDEEE